VGLADDAGAGLRAACWYAMTEADTTVSLGSGEVPVLATPRVLALAERATVEVVAGAGGGYDPRSAPGRAGLT
jgi:hypothetical protein